MVHITCENHKLTISWVYRTIRCHTCSKTDSWPETWESNIHKPDRFTIVWHTNGILTINL